MEKRIKFGHQPLTDHHQSLCRRSCYGYVVLCKLLLKSAASSPQMCDFAQSIYLAVFFMFPTNHFHHKMMSTSTVH